MAPILASGVDIGKEEGPSPSFFISAATALLTSPPPEVGISREAAASSGSGALAAPSPSLAPDEVDVPEVCENPPIAGIQGRGESSTPGEADVAHSPIPRHELSDPFRAAVRAHVVDEDDLDVTPVRV